MAPNLSMLIFSAIMSVVHGDGKQTPRRYHAFIGMTCGKEGTTALPCNPPAHATPETFQEACDKCSGCLAAVLVKGETPQCQFRACDTSCGCFPKPFGGQCSSKTPPPDASHSSQHDLFAKTIAPHFCRSWAYEHQAAAAGSVVKMPRYQTYTAMTCSREGATVLPCDLPAHATPETCQKACDKCPNCVAAVLVKGGTPQCQFRGCDTGCGCYPGQCNSKKPPPDASRSSQHDLFAKTIAPHFCRSWAYEHQAAAAESVVNMPRYQAYTSMTCGEEGATVLPCDLPAHATPETCQKACDKCPNCVAAVLVRGDTPQCQFRGCDTSCGCYPGQCSSKKPPPDASHSSKHDLFAKTIAPHFCRTWAYEHHGVAGTVVKSPSASGAINLLEEYTGISGNSSLRPAMSVLQWMAVCSSATLLAAVLPRLLRRRHVRSPNVDEELAFSTELLE